jgi:hypothetical protein
LYDDFGRQLALERQDRLVRLDHDDGSRLLNMQLDAREYPDRGQPVHALGCTLDAPYHDPIAGAAGVEAPRHVALARFRRLRANVKSFDSGGNS